MTDISKNIETLLAQKEAQRVQIIREMQLDPNVKYTGQMARGVLYELEATIKNLKQLLNPGAVEEPEVVEPEVAEAVVEEPAVEEPVVEEPVAEEPAPEEPVAKQAEAEEPIEEEPKKKGKK